MKRILTILALPFLFFACNKEGNGINDNGKECTVSIRPIGEITTSESELTKAGNSNNLYVVQVFKGSDPFALGIFDDPQNMKLNLKIGSGYSIRICLVKDAKNLIDYYSLTNGGIKTTISSGPFYSRYLSTSSYYFVRTNRFFYNSNNTYQYYETSSATGVQSSYMGTSAQFDNIRTGKLNDIRFPTCTDWFYGEINNYSPFEGIDVLDIPLKRTGFKLKYELSGVTDGQVTVKVYNSVRTFIDNTTTTASYSSDTQFIAFEDVYSAWKYAANNYTESFTVAVTWQRGIGITQDLGTKSIQIKRNCLNNIRITLGSDDRGAGVSIDLESDNNMGSAENNINV